jgi:hypothetical protein
LLGTARQPQRARSLRIASLGETGAMHIHMYMMRRKHTATGNKHTILSSDRSAVTVLFQPWSLLSLQVLFFGLAGDSGAGDSDTMSISGAGEGYAAAESSTSLSLHGVIPDHYRYTPSFLRSSVHALYQPTTTSQRSRLKFYTGTGTGTVPIVGRAHWQCRSNLVYRYPVLVWRGWP